MHQIAEYHLQLIQRPYCPPRQLLRETIAAVVRLRHVIALGLGSVALYVLLFEFSADIRAFATLTVTGHKIYFLVPIVVAFVFSLVHGAFTAHFWDALGLKPRGRKPAPRAA